MKGFSNGTETLELDKSKFVIGHLHFPIYKIYKAISSRNIVILDSDDSFCMPYLWYF